jgi:hypothetical protein
MSTDEYMSGDGGRDLIKCNRINSIFGLSTAILTVKQFEENPEYFEPLLEKIRIETEELVGTYPYDTMESEEVDMDNYRRVKNSHLSSITKQMRKNIELRETHEFNKVNEAILVIGNFDFINLLETQRLDFSDESCFDNVYGYCYIYIKKSYTNIDVVSLYDIYINPTIMETIHDKINAINIIISSLQLEESSIYNELGYEKPESFVLHVPVDIPNDKYMDIFEMNISVLTQLGFKSNCIFGKAPYIDGEYHSDCLNFVRDINYYPRLKNILEYENETVYSMNQIISYMRYNQNPVDNKLSQLYLRLTPLTIQLLKTFPYRSNSNLGPRAFENIIEFSGEMKIDKIEKNQFGNYLYFLSVATEEQQRFLLTNTGDSENVSVPDGYIIFHSHPLNFMINRNVGLATPSSPDFEATLNICLDPKKLVNAHFVTTIEGIYCLTLSNQALEIFDTIQELYGKDAEFVNQIDGFIHTFFEIPIPGDKENDAEIDPINRYYDWDADTSERYTHQNLNKIPEYLEYINTLSFTSLKFNRYIGDTFGEPIFNVQFKSWNDLERFKEGSTFPIFIRSEFNGNFVFPSIKFNEIKELYGDSYDL